MAVSRRHLSLNTVAQVNSKCCFKIGASRAGAKQTLTSSGTQARTSRRLDLAAAYSRITTQDDDEGGHSTCV